MKIRTLATALLLAAPLLFVSPAARGTGFAINEWGARPLGMANAFTAIADGPGAIVFNPAGMAQLSGFAVEGGVTLIAPQFSYTVPVPGRPDTEVAVEGDRGFFPIPALFATFRLHDRVAAGLGAYSMYGLGVKWPGTVAVPGESAPRAWWARDQVQEVDLKTFYVNPALAVKISQRVLLGAGFNVIFSSVFLKRAVTFSADANDDIEAELAADHISFGATAGLLIKAIPELLNVGFTYRSGTTLAFEGNAVFNAVDGSIPVGLQSRLVDSKGSAEIPMPHNFSFGLAAFPLPELKLGFALEVTSWSSFDRLRLQVENDDGTINEELSSSVPENWRNTITLRLGAEYTIAEHYMLRGGIVYDQSPVPNTTVSPMLPDADRYELALGAGYRRSGFSLDLAYLFLSSGENQTAETAPLVGSYGGTAHLVALSLGYAIQ